MLMIFHASAAYQCRDPLKNTRILSLLNGFHIIDQVQGFLIIPYSRNRYHVTRLRTTFLRIPLFTTYFVCSRVAPIVPIVSVPLVSPYTSLFGR